MLSLERASLSLSGRSLAKPGWLGSSNLMFGILPFCGRAVLMLEEVEQPLQTLPTDAACFYL